jgi:hypothetical protein
MRAQESGPNPVPRSSRFDSILNRSDEDALLILCLKASLKVRYAENRRHLLILPVKKVGCVLHDATQSSTAGYFGKRLSSSQLGCVHVADRGHEMQFYQAADNAGSKIGAVWIVT